MNEDSCKPPEGPSRRGFLTTSAGAAAAIGSGVLLSAQTPAAVGDEITLALVIGRIHTLDAANTIVNTVTIRNGRPPFE